MNRICDGTVAWYPYRLSTAAQVALGQFRSSVLTIKTLHNRAGASRWTGLMFAPDPTSGAQ